MDDPFGLPVRMVCARPKSLVPVRGSRVCGLRRCGRPPGHPNAGVPELDVVNPAGWRRAGVSHVEKAVESVVDPNVLSEGPSVDDMLGMPTILHGKANLFRRHRSA